MNPVEMSMKWLLMVHVSVLVFVFVCVRARVCVCMHVLYRAADDHAAQRSKGLWYQEDGRGRLQEGRQVLDR